MIDIHIEELAESVKHTEAGEDGNTYTGERLTRIKLFRGEETEFGAVKGEEGCVLFLIIFPCLTFRTFRRRLGTEWRRKRERRTPNSVQRPNFSSILLRVAKGGDKGRVGGCGPNISKFAPSPRTFPALLPPSYSASISLNSLFFLQLWRMGTIFKRSSNERWSYRSID